MVCPQRQLSLEIFHQLDCEVPTIFQRQIINLPFSFMGYTSISVRPSQLHSLAIAAFACLVAPFVGFLIQGVKRAYKISVRFDRLTIQ